MSGTKLDAAGTLKMKTLDEATLVLQRLHALVERMAVEVKAEKGVGTYVPQIKRIATPLQGQLKGQFGLIADQVAQLILVSGRGGGEQMKVRSLRESVAQIRTALELAAAKVKEQHSVPIDIAGA
jgi:hypothetical protein